MGKGQGSFYFQGNNNLGVLLCHGLTGAPDEMRELGEHLNNIGYTVSCPQYSGHGMDSDNFLNTSVDMWYEDLENAFLELSKKVNGVYIMGLSMGGTFTVRIAENHEILGLVTMNAPLIGLPLKERFEKMISETNNLEDLEKDRISLTKYNKFVIETGQSINLLKVIAPLLVVQGELDVDRYKISSSMLTKYTGSKYVSRLDFKKSGHVIVLEEERYELYDLIANFLCEINKIFY
jgi:carboxylesterase